jgi:hypothetical protein
VTFRCRALAGATWGLPDRKLGSSHPDDGSAPTRRDACVEHLFQTLPLKTLGLYQAVPSSLSPTVSDGVKNNYSLVLVQVLRFNVDGHRLQGEKIKSYVHADRSGREASHAAVSTPRRSPPSGESACGSAPPVETKRR